jgi:hypothetical protein
MLKKQQLQKCFRIGKYFWPVNQLKLNTMKKLILISVLVLSAVVMNAQVKAPTAKNTSTPVSIKVSDLPKTITDNIAKNYVGYMVKEAYTVTQEGKTNYQVIINKGTTHETLLYDANGNFIRKMEAKSESTADKQSSKPPSKPVTKTNPGTKK